MEHKGAESGRGAVMAHGPPQCAHRVTNFYIDNILRADFGQRRRTERRPVDVGLDERKEKKKQRREATTEGEEEEEEEEETEEETNGGGGGGAAEDGGAGPAGKQMLWPAWVYCTRYSDRPSAGPRSRKPKRPAAPAKDDKRPRTAFSAEQLQRLKSEFQTDRYLTEQRRQGLAHELGLNESQIKIWFQNKRAKIKKASGNHNALALHLRAQGLYNHSTSRERSDSD